MVISGTTPKDTMLMLIGQQKAKVGGLRYELEVVALDPSPNRLLVTAKAGKFLTVLDVGVFFGSWPLGGRKPVLPLLEELNGPLY